MKKNKIYCGDCIEVMKKFPECSIDALVSDPPYGLGFMGKDWDKFSPKEFQDFSFQWGIQALRILKPGAYLAAFSGSRTYHRMVCGLEDAGFEITTLMIWAYSSGFPKALDISKALDKHLRVFEDRKEVGIGNRHGGGNSDYMGRTTGKIKVMPNGQPYPSQDLDDNNIATNFKRSKGIITEPFSEEAKQWNGWYTQLKPAFEPIVLAQKPREGTFAENILKWGVGALNIDACRIKYSNNETDSRIGTNAKWKGKRDASKHTVSLPAIDNMQMYKNNGRFPSNLLLQHHTECKIIGTKKIGSGKVKHNQEITRKGLGNHGAIFRTDNSGFDVNKCQGFASYGVEIIPDYDCHPDCPLKLLDFQSGNVKVHHEIVHNYSMDKKNDTFFCGNWNPSNCYNDSGGASRFFQSFYYSGKAHKSERNAGLEHLNTIENAEMVNRKEGSAGIKNPRAGAGRCEGAKNDISTLKPINLMRYLVKLTCPKGGLVLDPFGGSGTTGIACIIEGMDYILIEKRERFAKIISPARLLYWADPNNWDSLKDHKLLTPIKDLKSKRLGQKTMFDF